MTEFNLHRLRLLRELQVRGTITKVAEALTYSPSAVSQQLNLLASEMGVPIVELAGRTLKLTPQGEILARHAEIVLSQLDFAEAELASSLAEVSGTLRVASLQTVAQTLIPAVIAALQEQFPSLVVNVTDILPDQSLPLLMAHDFDLVIGEEYPGREITRPNTVHIEDFLDDPIAVIAPTAWATTRGEAGLRDLAARPWAMEASGKPTREWVISQCRRAGFEPDVRYESNDLLIHVKLVQAEQAAAFLPGLLWNTLTPDEVLFPLRDAPARRVFTAVREGSQNRPAIKAFRQELVGLAAKFTYARHPLS